MQIKIDEELKNLIPPLSSEEKSLKFQSQLILKILLAG
jgi:hypothetical protein